jgi:hypothetical protein
MDLYAIPPFPDAGYTCNEKSQQEMQRSARHKDRTLTRAFAGMMVSFLAAVGLGFLHLWPLMLVALGGFLFCFVVLLALLLRGPSRPVCEACGQRMTFTWRPGRDGRGLEYLVCEPCRRYVYTFRTSR